MKIRLKQSKSKQVSRKEARRKGISVDDSLKGCLPAPNPESRAAPPFGSSPLPQSSPALD
jgi:hypothetical protein